MHFAAGAVYYIRKIGADLLVRNYGGVIKKAYEVLDPIAGQLMSGYSESEVQQAIKLVVTRVGDSEIDESGHRCHHKLRGRKIQPCLWLLPKSGLGDRGRESCGGSHGERQETPRRCICGRSLCNRTQRSRPLLTFT